MVAKCLLGVLLVACVCATCAIQESLKRKLRAALNALLEAARAADRPLFERTIAKLDPTLPQGGYSGLRLTVMLAADFGPFGSACVQMAQRVRVLRQKRILGLLPLLAIPAAIQVYLVFGK